MSLELAKRHQVRDYHPNALAVSPSLVLLASLKLAQEDGLRTVIRRLETAIEEMKREP